MSRRGRGRQPWGGPGGRPALRLLALSTLAAVLLAGCTGDLNTPGEALRILGATLPTAYLGEPYDQPVQAVGGLRPYDFSVVDGTLPAGIQLQGGTLRGTPSKIGQYTFTVQVSDANLSKTVQRYELTVAEIPPPTLVLNAPSTQVDRRVTLRAEVRDARDLEGLSTQIRWDPQRFRLVADSLRASRQGLALLHRSSEGELQVDIAPLGTTLNGDATLFQFDLEPVAGASYLKLDLRTVTVSASGRHFAQTSEGRAPQPAAAPSVPTGGSTP